MKIRRTYYKLVWDEISEGLTLKKTIFWLVCLWVLSVSAICLCSCEKFKHYPHDNIIEEMAERYIEDKTGVDIDLSPSSPE